MRFAFIEENQQRWPVELMCQVLRVSRSGYYQWLARPISARQQRQEQIIAQIQEVHDETRGVYGSPRQHQELLARGIIVCQNTVAKLMKQAGIRAKTHRRFLVRTTDSDHDHPVASNRLRRRFDDFDLPDRAWVADITYVPTDEGWLYFAAVMDLCSRKIVGWAMADHLRADLCTEALQMALARRRPPRAGLLHHSDRGVQYACDQYQAVLAQHGIECSMSRRGDCYDNAAMESFFATLKTELVYHEHYATLQQARQSIFEYVEVFYNRKRRHSSLGYLSPEQFEASLN